MLYAGNLSCRNNKIRLLRLAITSSFLICCGHFFFSSCTFFLFVFIAIVSDFTYRRDNYFLCPEDLFLRCHVIHKVNNIKSYIFDFSRLLYTLCWCGLRVKEKTRPDSIQMTHSSPANKHNAKLYLRIEIYLAPI
jgi:hypothetical protein